MLPGVIIVIFVHYFVRPVMDIRIVLSAIPVAIDTFVNCSIVLGAKIIYATKI